MILDNFFDQIRKDCNDDEIQIRHMIYSLPNKLEQYLKRLPDIRQEECENFEKYLSETTTCEVCACKLPRNSSVYVDWNGNIKNATWEMIPGGYVTCSEHMCLECAKRTFERHTRQCSSCSVKFYSIYPSSRCSTCSKKRKKIGSKVYSANRRTALLGLPASLTIEQWTQVLDFYKWRCAYCGGEFEELEHVKSVSQGGGTELGNVVPSCIKCNHKKIYAPLYPMDIL